MILAEEVCLASEDRRCDGAGEGVGVVDGVTALRRKADPGAVDLCPAGHLLADEVEVVDDGCGGALCGPSVHHQDATEIGEAVVEGGEVLLLARVEGELVAIGVQAHEVVIGEDAGLDAGRGERAGHSGWPFVVAVGDLS